MLMPADIARMPHDTTAAAFTELFDSLNWKEFEMFVVAEATRNHCPPGLFEALAAPDVRTDWEDALDCYADECLLSIMSRSYRHGPQSQETIRSRSNLRKVQSRRGWVSKNPVPAPATTWFWHRQDHAWAVKQLAGLRRTEYDDILAVTADDPGYQVIPVVDHSDYRSWCLQSGYPYPAMDADQKELFTASRDKVLAVVSAETETFGEESVFAHPLFMQQWKDDLEDMRQQLRERVGLDLTYTNPYLRETDLVFDPNQDKAVLERLFTEFRRLAGIYRRQREAVRVFKDLRMDMGNWRERRVRPAGRIAMEILAARHDDEVQQLRAQWVQPVSPHHTPPVVPRKDIPRKAEVFIDAAETNGWRVVTYLPERNPHPWYPNVIVCEATRSRGVNPVLYVRFQTLRATRTTRVNASVRITGYPVVTLQDLSAALILLPMTEDQITNAVLQRHAQVNAAANRRAARVLDTEPPVRSYTE